MIIELEIHRRCTLGICYAIGYPIEGVDQTKLRGTSPFKSGDDGACERVLGGTDWFEDGLRIDLVADDGHLAIHAAIDIGIGI